MIVSYSKSWGRDQYEIGTYRLTFCSRLKRAEWAATFAAGDYTSVWLVPSLED